MAVPSRSRFATPGEDPRHFIRYGGFSGTHSLNQEFVVVDTETSGFSPVNGDRILEISAIRTDGKGNVLEKFSSLVNPGNGEVGATHIHHITPEMVADAPTFSEITTNLLQVMSGAIFVAHNAVFDEMFVAAEFKKAGVALATSPGLCTLWLAQQTLSLPNFKLGTISDSLGITNSLPHAAEGDAAVVVDLLPALFERAESEILYYDELPTYPDSFFLGEAKGR